MTLAAAEHEVAGWAEAIETYFERGWTDGLPVVPATAEAVRRFLDAAGRRPDDVVLRESTRRRTITAEKIAINAVGALPGLLDRSTQGHPGKYTFCIAELEEESPWEPLHVARGLPREASAVTVFAAEGPHNVLSHYGETAEAIVVAIADTMAC